MTSQTNPTTEALADLRDWQERRRTGVMFTFATPAAFFDAMLPHHQHDAHVETYRGERWLRERREGAARGFAACEALVEELKAKGR